MMCGKVNEHKFAEALPSHNICMCCFAKSSEAMLMHVWRIAGAPWTLCARQN